MIDITQLKSGDFTAWFEKIPVMRVPQKVIETRREHLTTFLMEEGYLPLSQLCARLGVSEATARRDLAALDHDHRITRTYGGALGEFNATFTSFRERLRKNMEAKEKIARLAVTLINPGTRLYLDAGTTAFAIAKELRRTCPARLTIITNNLALLETLGFIADARIHLLGGRFLGRQSVLFGEEAIKTLSMQEIDLAFMGAQGMNEEGIWNSHPEIVRFQREVMKRATMVCFCMDRTKLRLAPEYCAPWSHVGRLITDLTLSELERANIHLKLGTLFSTI